MGSKKQRNKQDKTVNTVPIQVKGTVYNIHPAVMDGIQNLNNQYNGLVGEYKTVLSMNQTMAGQLKRIQALFITDKELTPDQQAIAEEIEHLVSSPDQDKNDRQYQRVIDYEKSQQQERQSPEQGPMTEAEAAVAP